DVDGDTLTYSLVSGPANGTLALNGNGSFTYTPAANFNGTDAFTYKANDGKVDSNTATFTLTVRPVNDAPVAANASVTTDEDTAVNATVTATDVDSPTLTYALVAGPAHGTVVLTGSTGSYVYTPTANYNGPDSFTYKANDGAADSNVATVSITVTAVNDAPVAKNDSAATDEDTAAAIAVLANDTDVDGDTLTVSAVTQPAHGAVVVNADGTVTYTPAANYNGADSFGYTVSDGHGGTATATVALTVRAVNDAPVAADDGAATDEDAGVTITVLSNDTDVDGDTLSPVLVAGPAHGTAVVNADGTMTYTPAANYNGSDSFTYKANDGSLSSNVATVSLTVRAVNDAPVAKDDSYATDVNVALTVPAAGVLANDTDVDGDALAAVLVSGPANGTLTLNTDGSFTYTPAGDFTGTDTFTYRARDGAADSALATVTVQVNPAGNTEGAVTGGGAVDAGRRKFTVNVKSTRRTNGTFVFSGNLSFNDLDNKIKLQSTAIRSFHVNAAGTRAVFGGTAKVNGKAGYTFVVIAEDLGEPGAGLDKFRIMITGPAGFQYDSIDFAVAEGVLSQGNLQVKKRP
ncbi:MAG TPA: Ig-like domain-containing protein, partial [Gemmataceae bacterium]|nr:Ig-like domain-containing protein [Gemmataceae bacterium]